MKRILPRTFGETQEQFSQELIEKLVQEPFYYDTSIVRPHVEMIEVTHWVRYPSYDFLFGKPIPESPRYEKEIACMVIRYEIGKVYAHYFDTNETRDTIEALLTIYNDEKHRIKK